MPCCSTDLLLALIGLMKRQSQSQCREWIDRARPRHSTFFSLEFNESTNRLASVLVSSRRSSTTRQHRSIYVFIFTRNASINVPFVSTEDFISRSTDSWRITTNPCPHFILMRIVWADSFNPFASDRLCLLLVTGTDWKTTYCKVNELTDSEWLDRHMTVHKLVHREGYVLCSVDTTGEIDDPFCMIPMHSIYSLSALWLRLSLHKTDECQQEISWTARHLSLAVNTVTADMCVIEGTSMYASY